MNNYFSDRHQNMHLVRIHVKPRVQHGHPSIIDQADLPAVSLRREYGLPTSSERLPQFKSSLWQLLPFVGRVSNT